MYTLQRLFSNLDSVISRKPAPGAWGLGLGSWSERRDVNPVATGSPPRNSANPIIDRKSAPRDIPPKPQAPSPTPLRAQRRAASGFTLIELMIVVAIIGILAAMAVPTTKNMIRRTREAVLRHNLAQMREMIDQFYADRLKYPKDLKELVTEGGYFRALPRDPFTKKDDWVVVKLSEAAEQSSDSGNSGASPGGSGSSGGSDDDGVWDVHSNAEGKGLDGTEYKTW